MKAETDGPRLITNSLDAGPGVEAFFTFRSPLYDAANPYDGFNVCHYTGDTPSHIACCRQLLSDRLSVPDSKIIIPRQTHSTNVAVIDTLQFKMPDNTDALVTRRSDLLLCINTADCLPVLLNDPKSRTIGIAHAGWRGLDGGIIAATIRAMTDIGACAADIHAAIGPCIFRECYEVDLEFARRFASGFPSDTDLIYPSKNNGKALLDLPAAAIHQLKSSGICPERISPPPLCTRCNHDFLFSARVHGISSGRILSAIRLT